MFGIFFSFLYFFIFVFLYLTQSEDLILKLTMWQDKKTCFELHDALSGKSNVRRKVQKTAKRAETLEGSASAQILVVIKCIVDAILLSLLVFSILERA